jgi:membrane protein YdbS with pleckstrin-like domain
MDTTESTTEEAVTWLEIATAVALRGAELAVVAVATVFIAPPLVILAVVVIVPLLALAAVVSVVAVPVLVVRRVHRHRSAHPHQFVHRLRARAQRA